MTTKLCVIRFQVLSVHLMRYSCKNVFDVFNVATENQQKKKIQQLDDGRTNRFCLSLRKKSTFESSKRSIFWFIPSYFHTGEKRSIIRTSSQFFSNHQLGVFIANTANALRNFDLSITAGTRVRGITTSKLVSHYRYEVWISIYLFAFRTRFFKIRTQLSSNGFKTVHTSLVL